MRIINTSGRNRLTIVPIILILANISATTESFTPSLSAYLISPLSCDDAVTFSFSILYAMQESSSSGPSQTNKQRRKKNKYASFSKVDELKVDPFEALISESKTKNKEIERESARKKNKRWILDDEALSALRVEKRDRNKREFPDTKTIDPYDPTTYGYTELGTILGAHGVHGLLKIAVTTDFPERLCTPGIRHLKAPNRRSPREIRLVEGRHRMKNEYLIKFENIGDREEANRLRGSVLYARQEERPKDMSEDEYLVTDLVGLDVVLVTGYGEDNDEEVEKLSDIELERGMGKNFVGTVRGIVLAQDMCSIPGLGQDLLEVVLPRGKLGIPSWRDEMVLIPLVPKIVPTIDIEQKIIYIDPPRGLLDLTYIQEENVRIKGFLPPAKDN